MQMPRTGWIGFEGIVAVCSAIAVLLTTSGVSAQTEATPAEEPTVPVVEVPAAADEVNTAAEPLVDPLEGGAQLEDRNATDQRLREIGNQVDILKEDTFATKSRLLLLRESVLRRTIAGSKVVVIHSNEMGAEYQLIQVLYALDGDPKFERLDYSGKLDKMDAEVVIDEKVVPGSHGLVVKMVYKGNDWGIFRYMDGYEYSLSSSYVFNAEEGRAHEIIVRAHEKGGFFTPLEDRPSIQYETTEHELDQSNSAVAATSK
ncbi:MAG: hypothetical protein CO108_19180 [Deltaproteobacteria bacterium CG_4_9_14_3_um_filter_63_12]|nr:MAG: hypothetical protein CO108_19180 [Deltaproteobacteria bacterium CG_4_9_14_3_um_filter_63_12]